ncbi:hypothetical protein AMK59_160, partial [Oryctes borbonicus]
VWANYLIPSVIGCLLFILQTAADIGVVYSHFRENNPIWASLTISFLYCPVLGCLIWCTTSLELWPQIDGMGFENINWLLLKILQHVLFPVWGVWRYAEKIFWSIEALRNEDEEAREEALENVTAPRIIEFYFFLQAFLQSLPQILLQVHILMRYTLDMKLETVQAQTMSVVMNLIKVSIVTTLYQRFKTQKIGGKDYPWYKSEKYDIGRDSSVDVVDSVATRFRAGAPQRRRKRTTGIIYATRENAKRLKREYESRNNTPLPMYTRSLSQRRPSSDLYMLPTGIVDQDEVDAVFLNRETSVLDGPPRRVYKGADIDETDFPRLLREIKGLPEDDIVGKLIAFFWWFCFFIARILALVSFAYFYPGQIIWLVLVHFIICEAFLIYDVKTYVVKRHKAVFYIFVGLIYIFCIIEFMKKFKKTTFIYYGFFALVYVENFVTCLIWWFSNLESDEIQSDWWFRFIFISVIICTLFSLSSMIFYILINKPKKVVVDEELVEGNPL